MALMLAMPSFVVSELAAGPLAAAPEGPFAAARTGPFPAALAYLLGLRPVTAMLVFVPWSDKPPLKVASVAGEEARFCAAPRSFASCFGCNWVYLHQTNLLSGHIHLLLDFTM